MKLNTVVLSTIILVGIFHLTTIRPGHEWGGDFSMYIHHAKNIVEGNQYQNTGYIFNPSFPSLAPRSYPFIFPLLLSPVYKLFALDLMIMKIEVSLFFLFFYLSFSSFSGKNFLLYIWPQQFS